MRRKREREMEAEFAFHLEREAAEQEAAGVAPAPARRQAALALGSEDGWKEAAREARGMAWLAGLGRDLRLALRGLGRAPGFTAVAVATLALGLGANTAMFSVVRAVLLAPLPYAQPQRLAYVWDTDSRHPGPQSTLDYPDFLDVRGVRAFAGLSAFAVNDVPLTGAGEAQDVRVASVSANLLEVLGVAPARGRGFHAGEDRPGSVAGADAALLGDALARARFGNADAALGQRLTLAGRPYVVVGVMPAGFQFPLDDHEDLWTTVAPLQVSTSGPPAAAQRGFHFMRAVGRLAAGASPAAAEGQLNGVARQLAQQHPSQDQYLQMLVVPMLANYTAATRPVLLLLLGAVGCVLLIACVNLAGLLLARAMRRRHEFALRAALGASRAAVLRQLGCESLLLGLLGALFGVGLAATAVRGLIRLGPDTIVRLQQARLDPPVLAFALGLGVATALLFGLLPALEVLRAERGGGVSITLHAGGRGQAGPGPQHWRRGLVAAQFGIAVAVLVGALLLLHSLQRLLAVAPGFTPGQMLTATINIPDARYPQPGDDAAFFDRLIARLQAEPSIAAAAAGMPTPLDGNNIGVGFDQPLHPLPPAERPNTRVGVVTPDYFSALGIPVVSGRAFSPHDRHGAPEVAIVNQAFARQFLKGRAAVGAQITPGLSAFSGPPPARTIVGVVGDTRASALSAPSPASCICPRTRCRSTAWTCWCGCAPAPRQRPRQRCAPTCAGWMPAFRCLTCIRWPSASAPPPPPSVSWRCCWDYLRHWHCCWPRWGSTR